MSAGNFNWYSKYSVHNNKFDNNFVYIITNEHNKKKSNLLGYQPHGTIHANEINFTVVSDCDCEITIIKQMYCVIRILKD